MKSTKRATIAMLWALFAFGFMPTLVGAQINNKATVVSSASFRAEVAPDSHATTFYNRAVHLDASETTVTIIDSRDQKHEGSLKGANASGTVKVWYADRDQVNFYLPALVSVGPAKIEIRDKTGNLSQGTFNVLAVAPGIYSANASGIGPPAAVVLRVKANGEQSYELVYRYDEVQKKSVAVPINLGPEGDRVFLVLFGTGFRNNPGLNSVALLAGNTPLQVIYAGKQGVIEGYDQINALLPRSLAGRGDLTVVFGVAGQEANRVNIFVGGQPAAQLLAQRTQVNEWLSYSDEITDADAYVQGASLVQQQATSEASFILFEDTTSGRSVIPPDFNIQLPAVGVTRTWFNDQYKGTFDNNGGAGFVFDDDPRNPANGLGKDAILQITRVAANKVRMWVNFGGIQLPTTANLYPSGRGPVASFEAEWFEVGGRLKLLTKYHYIVASYLDVNKVVGSATSRATMPEEYKDRVNNGGDTWQPDAANPNGLLVQWGVVESPGQVVSYTLLQFDRIPGSAGQVNLGQFRVIRRQ